MVAFARYPRDGNGTVIQSRLPLWFVYPDLGFLWRVLRASCVAVVMVVGMLGLVLLWAE